MKLKLLQSGQAQEHEKCINYLSFIAQHCVCIHFWQWSQWIAFVVIMTNATGCRAIRTKPCVKVSISAIKFMSGYSSAFDMN